MREKTLLPELVSHFAKFALRLGSLPQPLRACIGGDMAALYHTGIGLPHHVDVLFSSKIAIPPDTQYFTVPDPDNPEEVLVVTMDGGFNGQMFCHPRWENEAVEAMRFGDVIVLVMTPLDLAVSLLSRFSDADQVIIHNLASNGRVTRSALAERADEMIDSYIGAGYLRDNLMSALDLVADAEASHAPG